MGIVMEQRRRNAVRFALFIAILAAVSVVGFGSSDDRANAQAEAAKKGSGSRFIGAWGASPQEPPTDTPPPEFVNQTIRNVVNTHVGGTEKVRIRLSNEFGDRPVTFESVFIGRESETSEDSPDDASIDTGTNKQLTFGGEDSVTLEPGEEMYSDTVKLEDKVEPFQDLAISFFLPEATGPATEHFNAQQTNFVATGDLASDETGTGFTPSGTSWFFLTDVDVQVKKKDKKKAGSVIALGDSLTDGFIYTTPDANNRYPDYLAERLQNSKRFKNVTVENQGISGNRVLFDNIGPSILDRLDRDALDQPGVTDVILQAGINDLASASFIANPDGSEDIGAEELIEGLKEVIDRTQARGIKIHCATITPSGYIENLSPATDENEEPSNPAQGMFQEYSTPEVQADKDVVNEFIRESGECDSVIDFDRAIHDPANPDDLRDDLQSPDNLHPNELGYKTMADSIDLSIFGK